MINFEYLYNFLFEFIYFYNQSIALNILKLQINSSTSGEKRWNFL